MAVLSVEALPLGFRFRPTDAELVDYYLKGKIRGGLRSVVEVIPEVDICKCEPWDLPDKSLIRSSDSEWFFFSPKGRKYPNGQRSNRATKAGYWKATGRDRLIKSCSKGYPLIGMKRTLVFHHGRAPKGVRTNWIMHEYRTTESEFESGQQGGFVLCRLFRKSEDRITTTEVDAFTERNIDEAENSVLSPTITRSSLGESPHGGAVTVEGITPIDQNLPRSETQEDSQNFHLTSNMQPTSTNMLPEDRIEYDSSYPWKLDDHYCSSTVASDDAYNETDVEGAKVGDLLDDLAKLSSPDHYNYPMLPSMEFPIFDGFHNGLQSSRVQSDNDIEDDCATEFLNTIFFNTEDFQPEISNAIAESSTDSASEGQKCMIADHSASNLVSSKESTTCSNEDIRATNALEDVGLHELLDGPHSYPSNSTNISNCVPHMQESKCQVTNEQNACLLNYSDVPYHEFSASTKPTRMESSRDLLSNKESETIQANLDNTGIQIRARQNLSSSENLGDHQGLTMRRVRLQKSMHNVSVTRTKKESITFCANVHKSIISEVGEYEKKLTDEGTSDSGSGYVDNVRNTSEDNILSTSYQDKRSIAVTTSTSSELSHELKSKSSLVKRWAPENAGKFKGRSGTMIRAIITMLTILLLLLVVISWSIMK